MSVESDIIEPSCVANYFLREKFLLTALEFYYEQLERGIVVESLKDFFSKADNFGTGISCETYNCETLKTSVSQATLDSCDLTRESEDNNTLIDQIKVLEFELRKRESEISGLRDFLTSVTVADSSKQGTEQVTSSSDLGAAKVTEEKVIEASSLEERALNFLVYEQLRKTGCRLTAVQFSEECDVDGQQNLDCWRDVGLTCFRPPALLQLLRNHWTQSNPSRVFNGTCDSDSKQPLPTDCPRESPPTIVSATQTEADVQSELDAAQSALAILRCSQDATKAELDVKRQQCADLRATTKRLESDIASLTEDSCYWRNQLLCLKRDHPELVEFNSVNPKLNRSGGEQSAYAVSLEDDADRGDSDNTAAVKGEATSHSTASARPVPDEFLHCITSILKKPDSELATANESISLAGSLDELVTLLGTRLDSILHFLPVDHKAAALPLLTQAICLHPSPSVRDHLLQRLFGLFSQSKAVLDFEEDSEEEMQKRSVILRQCEQLAKYLGPQRLESELLPQIWTKLNEIPRPPSHLRILLTSACGVIAPFTPSRLRSSLLLSVLQALLDEEKDEGVRSTAVRSLAIVVALMEDDDKLPLLLSLLDRVVCLPSPGASMLPPSQRLALLNTRLDSHLLLETLSLNSSRDTALAYLLPALAQWTMETNCLSSLLVETWIARLEKFSQGLSEDTEDNTTSLTDLQSTIIAIEGLVPFIFACVLRSLEDAELLSEAPTSDTTSVELNATTSSISSAHDAAAFIIHPNPAIRWAPLFHVQAILGTKRHERLLVTFQSRLQHAAGDGSPDSSVPVEFDEATVDVVLKMGDFWSSLSWVKDDLMMRLASILKQIPHSLPDDDGSNVSVEPVPLSSIAYENMFMRLLSNPAGSVWGAGVSAREMQLCRGVCHLIAYLGTTFGVQAIQTQLHESFQSLLMQKTAHGNYDFEVGTLRSGVLAGYLSLLLATKTKGDRNKVKVMLTNAVFLHSRDMSSLNGFKLAIWSLCYVFKLETVVLDVLLPALRPCASCADPAVRCSTSSLLHSLVACLSEPVSLSITSGALGAQRSLLQPLWQLLSRLARDDYASIDLGASCSARSLDPDTADWDCLCFAIGPLYSLYCCLESSPFTTAAGNEYPVSITEARPWTPAEAMETSKQILSLIAELLNLCVVPLTENLNIQTCTVLIEHRSWDSLTFTLLHLVNHLFPKCPEDVRDTVIVPWLHRLCEMCSHLRTFEAHNHLADQLMKVCSTAAFCVTKETVVEQWLVPALESLRETFVALNNLDQVNELTQLTSDLRCRPPSGDDQQHVLHELPVNPVGDPADTPMSMMRSRFTNFLDNTAAKVAAAPAANLIYWSGTSGQPEQITDVPANDGMATASRKRRPFNFGRRR